MEKMGKMNIESDAYVLRFIKFLYFPWANQDYAKYQILSSSCDPELLDPSRILGRRRLEPLRPTSDLKLISLHLVFKIFNDL